MHPFWRWGIAWKKDTLWSFPSCHFHIKINAVSLLGRVYPRPLNCSALTSWQPITGRSGTYNHYWCWQSPPLLMLLVLPASPWLVAVERDSLGRASDLHLKGDVWCQTTTKYKAVSCLLQNMHVNNYCLIRLKSSHPRHNMNAKPSAGDLWRKVPHLLPHVKWLKGCLLDAVVASKKDSLLDGTDPIFKIWVNDAVTQFLLLLWGRTTQATGLSGSRASQKIPSALQT